jgi:hypothetical protein
MNPDTTLQIVSIITALTGLVGAITGCIGMWISFKSYSKDNVFLRVKFQKNMSTFIPGQADSTSKKTYLIINVANIGRRSVTIVKAGYVNLKTLGGSITVDSIKSGPRKLDEGQSTDFMVYEDKIDYSDINYVAVYDSVGNEYKAYMASRIQRFIFWLLKLTKSLKTIKKN